MSPTPQPESDRDAMPEAKAIPHDLRLWACERLVTTPNRRQAARSLIASASAHGIDLDLMWGVISDESDARSPKVRQVCLAVLGAGRTAMLFHSSPEQPKTLGSRATQCAEISASIRACLKALGDMHERVGLAQCLLEPKHHWAHEVCTQADMIFVGELAYMRKTLVGVPSPASQTPVWPNGVRVRPVVSLDPENPHGDYDHLIEALESSYQDTLDCPELCGLRSMHDVVQSHMATGTFSPNHWLLIFKDDRPAGCCLLTHCPASNSIELVYLGIAPNARGMGLGRSVLDYGIGRLDHLDVGEVTCAVDTRNAPALHVYGSLGFKRFDSRLGFVAPIPLG